MFVIADRVKWRHNRIFLSFPRKDRHFFFLIECFLNLFFGMTGRFHGTVAICLPNSSLKNIVHLFLSQHIGIRGFLTSLFLFKEARLQVFTQMLAYSFFRITLHAGVNTGVNLQTIRIDVIICPVFLLILCTPSIKRIILPCQRIFIVFLHLPATIVAPLRFFGSHHTTQIFTEISCQSFFMVNPSITQGQRQLLQGVTFRFGYVSAFTHLFQNNITTPPRTLIMTYRIV